MSGPFDLRAIRNIHSTFIHRLGKEIDVAAQEAGAVAQKHVHQESGFKHGHPSASGSIESNTNVRLVRTSRGNRLIIANKAKHAWAQEDGARPHVIRAKGGKMLRFIGRGGSVVYRRSVNHPGNKPTKFLYRATQAAGSFEYQSLLSRLSRLAKRF